MRWPVGFHDDFMPEFRNLHRDVQDEIYAVARLLERFGPQLGRPRVDTLNGSRHANMKEMRFGAIGGEWRSHSLSIRNAGPSFWPRATSRAAVPGAFTARSSARRTNASIGI